MKGDRRSGSTSHDELLQEMGWVRVALNDFEHAAEEFTRLSDMGEVEGETAAEVKYRFGIVKTRMRMLHQVFRMYYRTGKRTHNAMVKKKTEELNLE